MSGHTPGPWHWEIHDHSMATLSGQRCEFEHVVSVSPCRSCVQESKEWKWGRCWTPHEADAVLIAAAPEMLAALKDALAFIKDEIDYGAGTFDAEARALSDRIAAVIKQAEGES